MVAAPSVDTEYLKLRAEFESMPGLCLNLQQIAKLLTVDRKTAADLLRRLEADGVLMRTSGGVYRSAAPLVSM
jgi:Mn-dependent DtxR family transcriptional regulator